MDNNEHNRSYFAAQIVDAAKEGAKVAIELGCEPGKMCNGCAFKAGTEANNDPIVVEAMKCLFEPGRQFMCHEREDEQCAGWKNAMMNE